MNKTTEALKLAEGAILTPYPGIRTSHSDYLAYHERMKKALSAIREALAEPVKQESVAWMDEYNACKCPDNEARCFSDKVFRMMQRYAAPVDAKAIRA